MDDRKRCVSANCVEYFTVYWILISCWCHGAGRRPNSREHHLQTMNAAHLFPIIIHCTNINHFTAAPFTTSCGRAVTPPCFVIYMFHDTFPRFKSVPFRLSSLSLCWWSCFTSTFFSIFYFSYTSTNLSYPISKDDSDKHPYASGIGKTFRACGCMRPQPRGGRRLAHTGLVISPSTDHLCLTAGDPFMVPDH